MNQIFLHTTVQTKAAHAQIPNEQMPSRATRACLVAAKAMLSELVCSYEVPNAVASQLACSATNGHNRMQ